MTFSGKKEKTRSRMDIVECGEKKLSRKSMTVKELRDYLLKREYEAEETDRVVAAMLD